MEKQNKDWSHGFNTSWSFQLEANEETMAFFRRMEEEAKAHEEAVKARIQQLFDETMELSGPFNNERNYRMILHVFSLGYQYGWNDHQELTKAKEAQQ